MIRETLSWVGGIVIVVLLIIGLWNWTAYRDVDELKENVPAFLTEMGYTNINYNGFSGGMVMGGFVWYQTVGNQGLLYEISVAEWRGEYHIYHLECVNAVSGYQ